MIPRRSFSDKIPLAIQTLITSPPTCTPTARGSSGLIRNRSPSSLDPLTSPMPTLPIGCARLAVVPCPVSWLGLATVPWPPLRSVHCPPRGLPAGTRGWLGLYFASSSATRRRHRAMSALSSFLFVERRQRAAFVLDLGGKRGVLRGARSFLGCLLLRALARQRGNHVGRIDAWLHPARDVGADPHPPVVANPALVDARGMKVSVIHFLLPH